MRKHLLVSQKHSAYLIINTQLIIGDTTLQFQVNLKNLLVLQYHKDVRIFGIRALGNLKKKLQAFYVSRRKQSHLF